MASQKLSDSFSRLYASNASLLIGMAFDLGMLLGHRTRSTPLGRKIRSGVSDLADRVVDLAPSSVANLVPDLMPSKASSSRRKPSRKKRTAG